jgi:uncharacterized protein YbaR (Trm112 family)
VLDPKLLEILRCPETKQKLTLAGSEQLAGLNQKIEQGAIQNRAGRVLSGSLSALLIREDQQVAYPVIEDIPVMLLDESIFLGS